MTSSILRKVFLSVLSVNATIVPQVCLYRQTGIIGWFGIMNSARCERERFCHVFIFYASSFEAVKLTLNLLRITIVAPPSNASKWQMGFNSAFKGLRQG